MKIFPCISGSLSVFGVWVIGVEAVVEHGRVRGVGGGGGRGGGGGGRGGGMVLRRQDK